MKFTEYLESAKTTVWGILKAAALGTTADAACAGNDARLSNARTPTSHAVSHATGGSDAITPASLGAASATELTAETTRAQSAESANAAALLAETTRAKGVESAKADLVGGLVPANQLPSFVDDVVECSTYADLPATGEPGKIYVARDVNLTYRWSGSTYVSLGQGVALGETPVTAYRGDRGKAAWEHAQETGNPHGLTAADLGLGEVLANINTISARVITLSTTAAITADGFLFGDDFTFPTGYVIVRILCKNAGVTAGADDAEVALHLNTSDGDYVAVGRGRASKGWERIAVSLPLAFYSTAGQIYVTLGTGNGTFGDDLVADDTYVLGSDWSGSFSDGWTHTAAEGNSGTITGAVTLTVGTVYKIAWRVTNRTAGSITVAAAGISVADIVESGKHESAATDTAAIVITPTEDFDGTVTLSVSERMTPAAPSISIIMQLAKV